MQLIHSFFFQIMMNALTTLMIVVLMLTLPTLWVEVISVTVNLASQEMEKYVYGICAFNNCLKSFLMINILFLSRIIATQF